MAVCRHCGGSFQPERGRMGRPLAFCSDRCRADHAAEQRRDWHRENDGAERPLEARCLACGAVVEQHKRSAGRMRRLCSQACRRARQAERKSRAGK